MKVKNVLRDHLTHEFIKSILGTKRIKSGTILKPLLWFALTIIVLKWIGIDFINAYNNFFTFFETKTIITLNNNSNLISLIVTICLAYMTYRFGKINRRQFEEFKEQRLLEYRPNIYISIRRYNIEDKELNITIIPLSSYPLIETSLRISFPYEYDETSPYKCKFAFRSIDVPVMFSEKNGELSVSLIIGIDSMIIEKLDIFKVGFFQINCVFLDIKHNQYSYEAYYNVIPFEHSVHVRTLMVYEKLSMVEFSQLRYIRGIISDGSEKVLYRHRYPF